MPILSPNDKHVRDILKTGSKAAALQYLHDEAAKIARQKRCDPSAVERSIIAHIALNAPYAGKEALDLLAKWLGEEHFRVSSNVVNLGPNPAPLVRNLRPRSAPARKVVSRKRR